MSSEIAATLGATQFIPVPSTGGPHHHLEPSPEPPFMPVKCDRCGHTHNLHGDCVSPTTGERIVHWNDCIDRPRTEQLPGQPKFNSLHISKLAVKVDGHSETIFIAILNGEAVGQIIGIVQPWKAVGARVLFVSQKHRHMGIGTRLVSAIGAWAKENNCTSIEVAVHKGNTEARRFWIRRRFIDDERDMSDTPEHNCMSKAL